MGLGCQGKEECWLVLDAEPGASLGIGFRQPMSASQLRAAALDGSIESLLVWHPVQAGDFFYIPANTVHAIGAGISLIEVQQMSDITYRLYDYGRPRDLHLDAAIAVAQPQPYCPSWHQHVAPGANLRLVQGPHFRLDHISGPADPARLEDYMGPLLVIPLDGAMTLSGQPLMPGECGLAQDVAELGFSQTSQCLIAQPIKGQANTG